MDTIVVLEPNRYEYQAHLAAEQSMSVAELIEYLQTMPQDAKVIFKNDNGYTYGYVNKHYIDII